MNCEERGKFDLRTHKKGGAKSTRPKSISEVALGVVAEAQFGKTVQRSSVGGAQTARSLDGDLWRHFWAWHDFGSYVVVTAAFAVVAAALTAALLDCAPCVDALGGVALFVEANLATGQLLQNCRRKSTFGLSSRMVSLWLVGDVGKTVYFVLRRTPAQFRLCGYYQITLDLIIFAQILSYRPNTVTLVSKI